ncbi:MAG: hypothetical protein H6595_06485 [Flavobacteriales bacterium]|nr:hypothetical protein [Flavobacteriales bacterium]MCB9167113.1 hypothetical protein [Flavobacteriales bacterium]
MRAVPPVLLFGLLMALCLAVVLRFLGVPFTGWYAALIGYFTILTLAVHLWLEGAGGRDPKLLVRRFMTVLVIKMFVSVVVVASILALLPGPSAVPLAVAFAALYLAYLAFSTIRLMRLQARS